MGRPPNLKKRIKILFIIVLIVYGISNCDIPKPSYNVIGPGILYTPL